MSGTVDYQLVICRLTDVIKELNVGFAPCADAAPSEDERRADAVGVLKALLSTLEQGPTGAAAAAEHGASNASSFSQKTNATLNKYTTRYRRIGGVWWSTPTRYPTSVKDASLLDSCFTIKCNGPPASQK